MSIELNFSKTKPVKCEHCGKEKGQHRALSLECPWGTRTAIGYTTYGPKVFTPKQKKQ